MRRPRRLSLPAAALLAGSLLVALALPLSGSAETAATREHEVLLQLYALDSKLDGATQRLASMNSTTARVARERESISLRLRAARRTLGRAQRMLGLELRALYEEAQPDALAVFLAATSFQDALDGVDDLARAASATESVIEQARRARAAVLRLERGLTERQRELRSVRVRATAEVETLEAARGERAAFLDDLRRRRRLDEHRIASLDLRARAAEANARAASVRATAGSSIASVGALAPLVNPGPRPRPGLASTDPGSSAGVRTIVVLSTGYALPGTTATGLPVGRGIVAVDPTVIPLGTRMTIPGYGEGVAADTGSAIRGVRIDLWFTTRKQALAWGWQTLTVTLH